MAIQTDFMAAINQIAAERGIEIDEVIEAIKMAVKTGFKRKYETEEALEVEIDKEKGSLGVYADKKVVKSVTNSATQISLDDAKKIEPKLKVGDHIKVDITPEGDFGRIAAQAARQVILQKIREAEKEAVMKEFKDKMGAIETGIVQRMDGDAVLFEIHKATARMPLEERIPGEFYRGGARLRVLLKKIQRSARGKSLIISRSDPMFLEELFALEIPEIGTSGTVEIKAIAREAGSRSKVAVHSNQEGIDPIGSCVGQKGSRINAIMDELAGEKVDIIFWQEEIDRFIVNALSPAEVISIKADKKNKEAHVVVPDDQLSLAIGKDGQNVRLAAKLTGWKIDIQGETIKIENKKEEAKGDEKAEKAKEEGKETLRKEVNENIKKAKPKAKKSATKTKKSTEKKVVKKAVKKTITKEKKATKKTATKAKKTIEKKKSKK